MTVFWGLEMSEFKWSKFGSANMFHNTDYHLRRTKFAVYQSAMLASIIAQALSTNALNNYVKQQNFIEGLNPQAVISNDDYVGAASFNIVAGIFVATVFGGAFFFDLIWPERQETPGVKLAWRICSIVAVAAQTAVCVVGTVIIASMNAHFPSGFNPKLAAQLLSQYTQPPLQYSHNGRAVASLAFSWVSFPLVVASAILMWISLRYVDQHGPFAAHVASQKQNNNSSMADTPMATEAKADTSEKV